MGQRHQIYVVRITENNTHALAAFHHQWCYGKTAAMNLIRLVEAAERAKHYNAKEWSDHSFYDEREMDTIVKAIYGIDPKTGYVSMVHNITEHLIEDSVAYPERGDNNDGASLLVIDEVKKEMRGCLFTPGHVEGQFGRNAKAWRSWTPKQYLALYYGASEVDQLTDVIKPVTQKEFEDIFKLSIKPLKKEKGHI